jgi:uncharacterized protein (DUF58 family)
VAIGTPKFIRDRVAAWALKRQGSDHLPVTLEKRRVYILPGKMGFVFALMLFAILLASMNYGNSMGFALTFLLASLGLVTMHHCHGNLTGTVVQAIGADPVFAGEDAVFEILLQNSEHAARYDLRGESSDYLGSVTDIETDRSGVVRLAIPTRKRGRLRLDRFGVSTRFPLSLFRSWSWIHQPADCLVFPSPAADSPLPASQPGAQYDSVSVGDGADDFSGLRSFRPGDSPRHIAWKALAREQELLVKQFSGGAAQQLWLDWDLTSPGDDEHRLSQLCRWILAANAAGMLFGLRLPGREIPPANGDEHQLLCLTTLALYPTPGESSS